MAMEAPEMALQLITNPGKPIRYYGRVSWLSELSMPDNPEARLRNEKITNEFATAEEAFRAPLILARDCGMFEDSDELIRMVCGVATFMGALK